MDALFWLANLTVLPVWALLIGAPRWAGTQRLAAWPGLIAGPLALYTGLVVTHVPALLAAGPSLAGIAMMLGTPVGATLAWAHLLTLDLWVGRGIYLDSRNRPLPGWAVQGALLLTLLAGPLGLLLYGGLCWWGDHKPVPGGRHAQ